MSTINNNTNNTIMDFNTLLHSEKVTEPTPFTYDDIQSVCYPFNYWEYPVTMDAFMRFCNGAKYIEVFGEDIVKMAISLLKLRDVVKEERIEEDSLPYYFKQCEAYLVENKKISYKDNEYKGSWSREVNRVGYKIIHQSFYNCWEGNFLKNCLCLKFPYLTSFKLECYHLSQYGKEFEDVYIKVAKTNMIEAESSLYCPISAFIEGDFSIIEKRMKEYFGQYYAERPEQKEKALECLGYLETLSLKQMMEDFNKDDTLFRDTKSYNEFKSKFDIKRKCYQPQYGEVFLVNESFYCGLQPSCAFTRFEDAYKEFMSRLKDKNATTIINFEEGTAQATYEDHIVVIQVIKVR